MGVSSQTLSTTLTSGFLLCLFLFSEERIVLLRRDLSRSECMIGMEHQRKREGKEDDISLSQKCTPAPASSGTQLVEKGPHDPARSAAETPGGSCEYTASNDGGSYLQQNTRAQQMSDQSGCVHLTSCPAVIIIAAAKLGPQMNLLVLTSFDKFNEVVSLSNHRGILAVALSDGTAGLRYQKVIKKTLQVGSFVNLRHRRWTEVTVFTPVCLFVCL